MRAYREACSQLSDSRYPPLPRSLEALESSISVRCRKAIDSNMAGGGLPPYNVGMVSRKLNFFHAAGIPALRRGGIEHA